MILSPNERLKIKNTSKIVNSAQSSLEYQIKKIIYLCGEIESELDKPRKKSYISEKSFKYNIDFLINGFSVLIEYFHIWVIQNYIGLIEPEVKISYKAIKKEDNNSILKLMNAYKIGITNNPDFYKFNFHERCKTAYISAMEHFFIGKNHEIFVLNNYIKHNAILSNYAPLEIIGDADFSFPYLYLDETEGRLLNSSILSQLLKYSLEDSIKTYPDTCKIGNLNIITINNLEYVKYPATVGIGIESILETVKSACVNILDLMLEENHNNGIVSGTSIDNFTSLKLDFEKRKAKTFKNARDKEKF